MRVLGLPLVAKLRDRPLLPGRHEDRVVAEALAASGLLGDPALQDARATRLLAPRRQRDELADVSRQAPVAVDAVELREQSPDRIAAAEPRRADARPAAEAVHLDAGVLPEHPAVVDEPEPVAGLGKRVLVVGGALLGRIAVRVEQAEVPAREHGRQLAQLALVPRCQAGDYSAQRTSSTSSTSASFETIRWVSSARGTSRVSSSVRRSPS